MLGCVGFSSWNLDERQEPASDAFASPDRSSQRLQLTGDARDGDICVVGRESASAGGRQLGFIVSEGIAQVFERSGRRWECLRGYAVADPVGWWFELRDLTDDPDGETVLFATWPDGGDLSVTQHRTGVPLEVVEWFTAEAKIAISPLDT